MEQQMENGLNKTSLKLCNKYIPKNPTRHKIRIITLTIVDGLGLIIDNIEVVDNK